MNTNHKATAIAERIEMTYQRYSRYPLLEKISGVLLKLNIGYGGLAPFEINNIVNTKYIAGKINKIEIFCLLVSFSLFPVSSH